MTLPHLLPLSVVELPLDILHLIFPYLDVESFLNLCRTCKALHHPSIRLDAAYWSFATHRDFRFPNQSVAQHDCGRWYKLYRRLLTQSRVYTWGSNDSKRLGQESTRPVAFPTEMENTRQLGAIIDMQCGERSTTLLTAKGSLHTVGTIGFSRGESGAHLPHLRHLPRTLKFPAGYPSSSYKARYDEPAIMIRQFSAGRFHVLALSDTAKIWSWYNVMKPALQVKFLHLDLQAPSTTGRRDGTLNHGSIKQVLAGWSHSSAYIYGVGIVVWDPVERDEDDGEIDTMLVTEYAVVPHTDYKQTSTNLPKEQRIQADIFCEVNSYILLEQFIVFSNNIGRVFYGRFESKIRVKEVFELRQLRSKGNMGVHVQGSFRKFAIFNNGEVIIADQDFLVACWSVRHSDGEQADIGGLTKVPALQHTSVVSIAFGKMHYLALHSNGRITSYGADFQSSGALGLGDRSSTLGPARGLIYRHLSYGYLHQCTSRHGRQVWFDSRKREWLEHIMRGVVDEAESRDRRELFHSNCDVQGEVSEWFEQEGRAWDGYAGDDGLGDYFALAVCAAREHSGALVLVNDQLLSQKSTYYGERRNFPRLELANGVVMPGQDELDEWREGRPELGLDKR